MEKLSTDSTIWPKGVAGLDPRRFASAELGQKAVEFQVERMKIVLERALASIL